MPEIHRSAGMPSSFHAQLAARHGFMAGDVRDRIGYGTLGPVMYAFSTWVRERVTALAADGAPVKAAFLLRDGHLPARAMQALTGDTWPLLRLSRFTANAACLRRRDDVVNLLAGSLSEKSMPALARQLLLPPAAGRIHSGGEPERQPSGRRLCPPGAARRHTVRTIFEASARSAPAPVGARAACHRGAARRHPGVCRPGLQRHGADPPARGVPRRTTACACTACT